METNADGAGGGVHGLAFGGIGGGVELAGWAHEGADLGAGVGGARAKHAGGGGAVDVTALAVGVDGVGGDSIGDDADSGWSICAGVGGGDAVGSGPSTKCTNSSSTTTSCTIGSTTIIRGTHWSQTNLKPGFLYITIRTPRKHIICVDRYIRRTYCPPIR